MFLIAWLIACVGIAAASHRRSWIGPSIVLVLWTSVPYVAFIDWLPTASPAPATTLVLILIVARIMLRAPTAARSPLRSRIPLLTLLFGLSFLLPHAVPNGDGTSFIADQIVAPLGVFFLVCRSIEDDSNAPRKLRNVIVLVASIQALIAIAHSASVIEQPFAQHFMKQFWFNQFFDREMGTLDHPLVLATLLLGATPLVHSVRTRYHIPVLIVLLGGMLLTQSRAGLLLGGFAVASIYLARRRISPALMATGAVAFAGAAWLLTTEWAQTSLTRFTYDHGSLTARSDALEAFFSFDQSLWPGFGPGASHAVAARMGLITSFESWPLMYTIDYGVLATLAYLVVIFVILIRSRGALQGARVAAVLTLTMTCIFSSLAVQSAASCILWFVLGLAFAGGSRESLHRIQPTMDTSYPKDDGQASLTARPGQQRRGQ